MMVNDTVCKTLTVTLRMCVYLQKDEAEGVAVEHLAILSGREPILSGTVCYFTVHCEGCSLTFFLDSSCCIL